MPVRPASLPVACPQDPEVSYSPLPEASVETVTKIS